MGSGYDGGPEAGGGRSSSGGALTSHRPLRLKLNIEANVNSWVVGVSTRVLAGGGEVRGVGVACDHATALAQLSQVLSTC